MDLKLYKGIKLDQLLRKMKPEEKREVKSVMKSAFPFLLRLFFYFTRDIIVLEIGGKIVGAAVLKIFSYTKNKKSGLIAFIFSSPEYQGKGVGQKLVEGGINYLEDAGCSDIYAMVEGDNTSSSKLFSNRGFNLLTPFEQLRLYGLKIFHVWFYTYHMFDIGCFMWVKNDKELLNKKSFQWVASLILHIFIYFIALKRRSFILSYDTFIAVGFSFLFIFGLRMLIMFTVAKLQGLKVQYRMWESGIFLNFIISTLFGGFVFAPGTLYPVEKNWSYRDYKKKLGIIALVSSIVLISVSAILALALKYDFFPELLPYISMAKTIAFGLVLYDVAFPVFPFSSYNGGRIWNWNKFIWAGLFIPIVIIFFFI